MVSIFKPDDANGDFCFPPKKYNNALLLNKIGGFWMVVAGRENFEHLRPLDPEMTILSPNSTFHTFTFVNDEKSPWVNYNEK
jgi:hypothetical protein